MLGIGLSSSKLLSFSISLSASCCTWSLSQPAGWWSSSLRASACCHCLSSMATAVFSLLDDPSFETDVVFLDPHLNQVGDDFLFCQVVLSVHGIAHRSVDSCSEVGTYFIDGVHYESGILGHLKKCARCNKKEITEHQLGCMRWRERERWMT